MVKNTVMRKVLYHAGNVFGAIGMILLVGCVAVLMIGLETITNFFVHNKPLVYCALAGLLLFGLGILLFALSGGNPAAAAPRAGAIPGGVACDKCRAANDPDAKFCDQCGTALAGRP
jgi:hypothetical protein